ncbi:transposable element Tcb2 transposase [Trichonephila clavipes]|nr:transposable element Tcb2 transposase [Trichonephila clavipes]
MNPIEHVWGALERRVAGRQPPPQALQELERALLEEWDRIPQLVINNLIDSMSQSFDLLLSNLGDRDNPTSVQWNLDQVTAVGFIPVFARYIAAIPEQPEQYVWDHYLVEK